MLKTLAPLLLLTLPLAAHAGPECQVRVLAPITDDLNNHWSTGTLLPVDIARDTPAGGSFCAHGGSCLPRKVNGADALQLLNCSIGPSFGGGDYRLIPSPQKAGSAQARAMLTRQNTEQKLSALGFSNASAGSLADESVTHPRSATSRLVAQALQGSQKALITLRRSYP